MIECVDFDFNRFYNRQPQVASHMVRHQKNTTISFRKAKVTFCAIKDSMKGNFIFEDRIFKLSKKIWPILNLKCPKFKQDPLNIKDL